MSTLGVHQLKRLVLSYCPLGGSSRGARELLSKWQSFESQRPAADFSIVEKKGNHPYVRAEFLNGKEKTLSLRNFSPKECEDRAQSLLDEVGKIRYHSGTRVISSNPSIQGKYLEKREPWNVFKLENGLKSE